MSMLVRIVDEMYEVEQLVDPVEVVVIFFLIEIARLSGSSGETIGAVRRSRYVDKVKVEGEDRDNSSVDRGGREYIRVLKHPFDVRRVNLYSQVADADEVHSKGLERAI
jgi:hypothetical protein